MQEKLNCRLSSDTEAGAMAGFFQGGARPLLFCLFHAPLVAPRAGLTAYASVCALLRRPLQPSSFRDAPLHVEREKIATALARLFADNPETELTDEEAMALAIREIKIARVERKKRSSASEG